jgi:hypothetical protein
MAQPFVEPCSRGIVAAEPCPRELGREVSPQRRRMVLAACVLASSMAFIDGSALTVALPNLRAGFGADLASVQWVVNGCPHAGIDNVGRRRTCRCLRVRHECWRLIFALRFGISTVRAGPSVAWLIAMRILQ